MLDYKVYFRDGNQRIFVGENIYQVIQYVFFELKYDAYEVWKIEEL